MLRHVISCLAVSCFLLTACHDQHSAKPAAATASSRQPRTEKQQVFQTKLIPLESRYSVGQPMTFRLEMENVSDETKYYDAQQVAVNHSIMIRDPLGNEVPYVAQTCQTVGAPTPLDPGRKVVLFEALDIEQQYLITKAGRYEVQFRGSLGIPPSNTVSIRVEEGRQRSSRELVSRLLSIAPEGGWEVSIVTEGEVTPVGRASAVGVQLYFISSGGKSKRVFVHVWATGEVVDAFSGSSTGPASHLAEHLGRSEWGEIYIKADDGVAKLWPDHRQRIKTALEMDSTP